MHVKTIALERAKNILESDGGSVYIDVRTEPEFINGHVPGSINVPVAWPNPSTGQMNLNPDFVKVVSAHFAKDKRIILVCQAGHRSKFAARLLAEDGFQDVSHMQGGFDGARDTMGRLIAPGWSQLGFPVETEVSPESSYASIKNIG